MSRSPVARILAVIAATDAMFTLVIGATYCAMMSITEGTAVRTAAAVIAVVFALRVAGWTTLTVLRLRPLAQWTAGPRPPTDEATIREVAATAYRAPFVVSLSWALMFSSSWLLTTLVLYFGFPEAVPIGPRSIEGATLVSFAILFGASEMTFPLAEWLMAPFIESVSLAAIERRLEVSGRGLSYRTRLIALALGLALAPSLFLSGIAYMNDAHANQRTLVQSAQFAASEAALGNLDAAREVGGSVFSFGADLANVDGRDAMRALDERPALSRALERAAAAAPSGAVSHPRHGAVAFRTQGDRRIGVVIPEAAQVSFGTVLVIMLFLLIIATWGPMSAVFIASATAVPVTRISEALARVGDGEVEAAPRVPVFHQDEVGVLAKTYNTMLEQLREVARRATEMSKGALDVEFSVRGELGDAFRGQLGSLREIVGHISLNASQLAGAASEMYAAAQEQEQAAHQQSVGIEEVTRTMESLLVAATHVTESTTGVLNKAERTRETTTRTAERISEMSAHANRIGEILEIIREIADRSDLLALNASLEGTRAGEAGRGFALVASEMRKLAERVTASVSDIKRLVSDVRASVSATVFATDESSKLAEGTTESARQINMVTQQQRSGTEQAGQSMRDVASMITQSLAATQQIRTLAENLKSQADNLTGLVARFRLPERRREAEHA